MVGPTLLQYSRLDFESKSKSNAGPTAWQIFKTRLQHRATQAKALSPVIHLRRDIRRATRNIMLYPHAAQYCLHDANRSLSQPSCRLTSGFHLHGTRSPCTFTTGSDGSPPPAGFPANTYRRSRLLASGAAAQSASPLSLMARKIAGRKLYVIDQFIKHRRISFAIPDHSLLVLVRL